MTKLIVLMNLSDCPILLWSTGYLAHPYMEVGYLNRTSHNNKNNNNNNNISPPTDARNQSKSSSLSSNQTLAAAVATKLDCGRLRVVIYLRMVISQRRPAYSAQTMLQHRSMRKHWSSYDKIIRHRRSNDQPCFVQPRHLFRLPRLRYGP